LPPPPPPEYITIEPTDPDIYYVPIYDPMVVYGPWPWPAYSPYYWYPPGYVLGAAAIGFVAGYFVGAAIWSHYNWAGGGVAINVSRYNRFNRTNLAADARGFRNWQFDTAHRGVVEFHNAALRQQYRRATGLGTSPGILRENVTPGGAGPLNTRINPNRDVNKNIIVNENKNINRTVNQTAIIGRNANINRNKSIGMRRILYLGSRSTTFRTRNAGDRKDHR
jgi:hypothetical protein